MRRFIYTLYTSFPVQLAMLHLKKFQVLLLLWYMLYSMVNGGLLKNYGAESLFFSPEYNGNSSMGGIIIIGVAWGMFIMSWNMTTFILHSQRFIFLAGSRHPFLKYCINNSLLPVSFMLFYFVKLWRYASVQELRTSGYILLEIVVVILSVFILVFFSFIYFYFTGRKITRSLSIDAKEEEVDINATNLKKYALNVTNFLDSNLSVQPVSRRSRFTKERIDAVLRRHHLAAVTIIILGFMLLATIGFFLDYPVFELPAGACIILLFSILIAVVGAFTYFLQSWSLPFAIALVIVLNFLVEYDFIDPRNQGYGLNYIDKDLRPVYSKNSLAALCTPQRVEADKANMLQILENWKSKQTSEKPLMIFINASGGGLRSASFTMNNLQLLDSLTNGGLMRQTMLISGASGGMIAAAYYRELYRTVPKNTPNPAYFETKYSQNITKDILNSIFSSMVARDLLATKQNVQIGKYQYTKDRGYAFEKKLGDNTEGLLNATLAETAADEFAARVPLIIFNGVINSDGRKLIIGTQPYSFLMKPASKNDMTVINPDAVDFAAMFHQQNPLDMRLVTALRVNASFPYILPNVWLPTKPKIDVMDAGLRDNYGQETTLRFIDYFKTWIQDNTSGVLIIQLRDSPTDNWQQPLVTKTMSDMFITPATMVQENWHKIQHNFLSDQYTYFKNDDSLKVLKAEIMYMASSAERAAAMSLHITNSELVDVKNSLSHPINKQVIDSIVKRINKSSNTSSIPSRL